LVDGPLVDRELWGGEELAFALAAPIWDRYGSFAGHPLINGVVTWRVEERLVAISGTRGRERFTEIVG
jgi:hypothetical protein